MEATEAQAGADNARAHRRALRLNVGAATGAREICGLARGTTPAPLRAKPLSDERLAKVCLALLLAGAIVWVGLVIVWAVLVL